MTPKEVNEHNRYSSGSSFMCYCIHAARSFLCAKTFLYGIQRRTLISCTQTTPFLPVALPFLVSSLALISEFCLATDTCHIKQKQINISSVLEKRITSDDPFT